MKVFRRCWNFTLLALAACAIGLIGPKIVDQVAAAFGEIAQASSNFAFEVAWRAVEGIGLLACILLVLYSIGSWAWRPVGRPTRLAYCVAGALFVAGVVVSAGLDKDTTGFMFLDDYITFLVVYFAAAMPIIAIGAGYPGIAAARRLRRGAASRRVAQNVSTD